MLLLLVLGTIEMGQVGGVGSWVDRFRWYRFEEEWRVAAPVPAVWDGMMHVEAWPQWWEGLEFSGSADTLPQGMAGKGYSTRWKGPFPYRLEIHAVIREVTPRAFIRADIRGDIEGSCTCRIEESRRGTRGFFTLEVRTTALWMTLLSPFLKGYFTENHNRLMAGGMRGFARHLAKGKAA